MTEPQKPESDQTIATGGGTFVQGDVATGGGNFTGRDHNQTTVSVPVNVQVTLPVQPTDAARPLAEPAELVPLRAVPCPYRGLEPFEAEHAANYFGRAAMVQKLLDKLAVTNFVAVVGPSGSGKSSLVRAGLITALHDGKLPGSKQWDVAILRPGEDPLRALAQPLVERMAATLTPVDRLTETRKLADRLRDGTLPIGDALSHLHEQPNRLPRLLLLIDQFEETFTLCNDETMRRTFLAALLTTAETAWVTVLFTLRADFFGRILADEQFGKRVEDGLIPVLTMNAVERRAAIEQPALNAGRRFEEGLVQRMLDDVAAAPGELPLLEFALTELWERQTPDGLLTHAAYEAIGELTGAIAQRADDTLKAFKPDEQAAVRKVFTRLVRVAQPDEGAEDTKRRIGLDELDATVQPLVRKLADARLLVTGRDEGTGEETVEVAHEALIRNWHELQSWLNGDREFLLWRQRLRTMVANWQASGRDAGALLRGALLTEGRGWLQTRVADLSEQERGFIAASQTAAEREAQEKAAQQHALALAEKRHANLVRQGLILVSGLFIIAVALAIYAFRNADLANQQLARLSGVQLLQEARDLKKAGKFPEAIVKLEAADKAAVRPEFDLKVEVDDVFRQNAIALVHEGEKLARSGDAFVSPLFASPLLIRTSQSVNGEKPTQQVDRVGAAAKYQAALDLNPPLDTPVYVHVPAGEFTMGSDPAVDQWTRDDEKPQHKVTVREFWIQRTEVTNAQYSECVKAKACLPPDNTNWDRPQLSNRPVTDVTWAQAISYTKWMGGRLPTEAEWEKACRGTDRRVYPWGNLLPTRDLANYNANEGTPINVGSYPNGKSPYGLLDMAGNVWEWTSSLYKDYPYKADDGREAPKTEDHRTLRGGSFTYFGDNNIRCAARNNGVSRDPDFGFRVVSPGF